MNSMARFTFAASMTLCLATPVLAHHSAAAFNTQQTVTVTGTVTRYRFANPHVYLTLDVKKPDGTVTSVEIEAGAASVLNGLGFNANSVKVGEVVSITGNPGRREPEKLLLGRDLVKADGAYVPLNIIHRPARRRCMGTPSAAGRARRWSSKRPTSASIRWEARRTCRPARGKS